MKNFLSCFITVGGPTVASNMCNTLTSSKFVGMSQPAQKVCQNLKKNSRMANSQTHKPMKLKGQKLLLENSQCEAVSGAAALFPSGLWTVHTTWKREGGHHCLSSWLSN